MIQRPEYGEGHPEKICCYCGELADTVDHVPSKVFLDEPYPENLPAVPCCRKCNELFSLDEEFIAVLLECVRSQTFDVERFKRGKVKKIVEHTPAIMTTVRNSVSPLLDEHFTVNQEDVRLNRVLTKLVAGHLRFEGLDQLFLHEGFKMFFYQDVHVNREFYQRFHSPIMSHLLPEVGSRALFAVFEQGRAGSPWFEVQPQTYEYCVAPDNSEVRIILQDFFGVRGLRIE